MKKVIIIIMVTIFIFLSIVAFASGRKGILVNKYLGNPTWTDNELQVVTDPPLSPTSIENGFQIKFYSKKPGYVYIFDLGTSGRIACLFPNERAQNNYISGGQWYAFPGGKGILKFDEKSIGEEVVIVLVTDKPMEFDKAYWQKKGILSIFANATLSSFLSYLIDHIINWVADTIDINLPFPTASPTPELGNNTEYNDIFLLSIGINYTFNPNINNLHYAEKDAKQFRTLAEEHGIPSGNIVTFLGKYATKRAILDGLFWLSERVTPQDQAIIFYSGHGTRVKDENGDESDGLDEALIPADANRDKNSFLIDDEFAKKLNAIKAKSIILVMDTCFAGGITRVPNIPNVIVKSIPFYTEKPKGISSGDGFEKDLRKENLTSLLASKENEPSIESEDLKEGVFTYYIIEGENKGYNLLHDLYNYTEKEILKYTENQQHPIYEGNLYGKKLFPK